MTYPFLKFIGVTVDVYEWLNNFIAHLLYMAYDYLSMRGLKLNHVSERGHGYNKVET